MFSPKKASFIHILDQQFAQDTAWMLLIMPFSFCGKPKELPYLALGAWAIPQQCLIQPLHTTQYSIHCMLTNDNWWMVMYMCNICVNYEPSILILCKTPSHYRDIGIHIDIVVYRYVSHIPIAIMWLYPLTSLQARPTWCFVSMVICSDMASSTLDFSAESIPCMVSTWATLCPSFRLLLKQFGAWPKPAFQICHICTSRQTVTLRQFCPSLLNF